MAYDEQQAQRVRRHLAGQASLREVSMFGGRAFMVDERLVVSVGKGGDLLLRCPPDRVDDLLRRPGASWAQMRERPMGRGWLRVAAAELTDEMVLGQWLAVAVESPTLPAPPE